MEVKYAVHPDDAKLYDTQRIRKEFHSSDLMGEDAIKMIYTHYDRFIYGTAFPKSQESFITNLRGVESRLFLRAKRIGNH